MKYLNEVHRERLGLNSAIQVKEDFMEQHPGCKMTFCDHCNITVNMQGNIATVQSNITANSANNRIYYNIEFNKTVVKYEIQTTCLD